MKYTVKAVDGRYNPNRMYATYEEAAQAAWLDNMSSDRATYAVYEVIDIRGQVAFRKVRR